MELHLYILFARVLLAAGCFGLLTSAVFLGLTIVASVRFRRARPHAVPPGFTPAVSILKPVHGMEPDLERNLRGFFEQDYPDYELLFCARTIDDAGLRVAQALAAEHPHVPTRFFTTGDPHYVSAKVHSLETMAAAARHELLLVSDSDVRVGRRYLSEVMPPFVDPKVGLVTCLYRGVALQGGLWARLEAIGMSIEMSSGAVVSAMLSPVEFALGPTTVVRRQALSEIGGFGRMGDFHCDDFLLGNWTARAGWKCLLSGHIVEHMVLQEGFLASMKHQIRWMKSTRASLPKGHLGTGLTFSVPYGILAALGAAMLGHSWLALALLMFSVVNRIIQALVVGKLVVEEHGLAAKSLLWVVRDAIGFGCWIASYVNRRILWRGEVFELGPEGHMHKLSGK